MNDNGKKNKNGKNGKKNVDPSNRIPLWSVTIKYWSLVVLFLAALLAVWTALFVASYDFSRYTDGDAIIRETPFAADAPFAVWLTFLKDYGLFTIPVLTVAAISLALILDTQENVRMTISRWLRKKADEEIREEGIAIGVERGITVGVARGKAEGVDEGIALGEDKANKAWDEWLRKMQAAQRDGKPFDEPPPSSRR